MSYENSAQPEYSAPPPPKPEPVYQPTYEQLAEEEPDGYGIPSAPVVSYEPEQPVYSAPPPPSYEQPEEADDSYGVPAAPVVTYQEPEQPTYSVPTYESPAEPAYEEDGYGAPAAPVESYDSPRPARESSPEELEVDDGYGAPAAPVLSYTPQQPTYHAPPPPPAPQRYRPKRKPYYAFRKKPIKSYNLPSIRKPKRHIPKPNTRPLKSMMKSMFHMPMLNMLFRMPRFSMPRHVPRLPSLNHLVTRPYKKVKPETVSYPTKQKKKVKLDYAGWTPIESAYSPAAPEYAGPEPEIITIDNAHQHAAYSPPTVAPPQTYAESAPEPITAKPVDYSAPQVIYGSPEPAYTAPVATYEVQEPPAPIEEPLFEYGNTAPIQDLNSLAESADEHSESQEQYQSSQYQSTHQASHLAQDVQSGSVYVQPDSNQNEEAETEEEDQDLYYIFYDKTPEEYKYQVPLFYQQKPAPAYSSPSSSVGGNSVVDATRASSASFSLHVNGQSHGFSHSLDHS